MKGGWGGSLEMMRIIYILNLPTKGEKNMKQCYCIVECSQMQHYILCPYMYIWMQKSHSFNRKFHIYHTPLAVREQYSGEAVHLQLSIEMLQVRGTV